MRLFISVKGNTAPAWEGFQWVVNNRVVSENRTTLQRSKGGWDWEEAATVDYAVSGNRMEIAVPLSQLGITDARDFTDRFQGSTTPSPTATSANACATAIRPRATASVTVTSLNINHNTPIQP